MSEPVAARRSPDKVTVAARRTYARYACGRRARQPFCDGSHANL